MDRLSTFAPVPQSCLRVVGALDHLTRANMAARAPEADQSVAELQEHLKRSG
jgi:hypothetical protein